MAAHEQSVGKTDEWYTPPYVFEAMGVTFDLDPCSPGPEHWAPADWVFTKEHDSANRDWTIHEWNCPCPCHYSGVAHALPSRPKTNFRPAESLQAGVGGKVAARHASASELSPNRPRDVQTRLKPEKFERLNSATYGLTRDGSGNGGQARLEMPRGAIGGSASPSIGPSTFGSNAKPSGSTSALTAGPLSASPRTTSSRSPLTPAREPLEPTWSQRVGDVTIASETLIPQFSLETGTSTSGSCRTCSGCRPKSRPAFVFMNPPFGGRMGLVPWLQKFMDHGDGVALTPDRTACPWWQDFAPQADRILFVRGKIKFFRPDGTQGRQPGMGTTLLAKGPRGIEALENAAAAGLGLMTATTRGAEHG